MAKKQAIVDTDRRLTLVTIQLSEGRELTAEVTWNESDGEITIHLQEDAGSEEADIQNFDIGRDSWTWLRAVVDRLVDEVQDQAAEIGANTARKWGESIPKGGPTA